MIEIVNLSNAGFNALFESFSEAFSDYEITLNRQEFQKMLIRRGFDANLSFAAFSQGKIVSFTFNGIGRYNGQVTAYDTGTGTIKDFRGQGLPSRVFNESIPALERSRCNPIPARGSATQRKGHLCLPKTWFRGKSRV